MAFIYAYHVFYLEGNLLHKKSYGLHVKRHMLGLMISVVFVLGITLGNYLLEGIRHTDMNIIYIPFFECIIRLYGVFQGDSYSIVALFGNIILYIPIGYFAATLYYDRKKNRSIPTVLCAVLAFIIELFKLFAVKEFNINDVILSTFGGFLGVYIFRICYVFNFRRCSEKLENLTFKQCYQLLLSLVVFISPIFMLLYLFR